MDESALFEIKERTHRLLGSQKDFIFSPESYAVEMGGWGSGKSYALCLKGLLLSAAFPGNAGLIGRFHATDLEDSTMPVFFEVCPPSWIKTWKKSRKVLTLKNNSVILFRHIHDPNPKRRHITSTNLGWFGIDQIEEIELKHWNTLIGRLRLPRARRRFGFGVGNPNGKDWLFDMFFPGYRPFKPNEFVQVFRHGSRLGVAGRSDENRKSNGGFVDDDYFDSLRQEMPPEWVARYLDCSFDDFTGKIYKEYTLTSIHNIEPFDIPSHWPIVVGIDVGGDTPWGVGASAIDENRNLIDFAEFHEAGVTTSMVANWIKRTLPWQRNNITYVIDPENKPVMIELAQDHRIPCLPAQKKVRPGIIRFGGFLHVNPARILPDWYFENQPKHLQEQWKNAGSPRYFIMKSRCPNTSYELDRYVWSETQLGKPKKENDHQCDRLRYVSWQVPQAAKALIINAARERLWRTDPLSAREWAAMDRRIAARVAHQKYGWLREVAADETGHPRVPSLTGKWEMY